MEKIKNKKNCCSIKYLDKDTLYKRLCSIKSDLDYLYQFSNCYDYFQNTNMASLVDDNLTILKKVATALCSAFEL